MFLLFTILGALSAVTASFFAKLWVSEQTWFFYALAALFFFIGGNLAIFAIKYGGLSVATIVTQITRLAAGVGLGVIYFHETLTTRQAIGLAIGFVAILILTLPESFFRLRW